MPTINSNFSSLHAGLQSLNAGRAFIQKNTDGSVAIYQQTGKLTLWNKAHNVLNGRKSADKYIRKVLEGAEKKARSTETLKLIRETRKAAKKADIPELQRQFAVIAAALASDYSDEKLQKLPIHISDGLRSALEKAAKGESLSKTTTLLADALSESSLYPQLCSENKNVHLPALLDFETHGKAQLAGMLQAASPKPISEKTAMQIVEDAYAAVIKPKFANVTQSVTTEGVGTDIGEFVTPAGDKFTPYGKLHEGGNGFVRLFSCGDKKIALKWIKDDKTKSQAARDILSEASIMNEVNQASELGGKRVLGVEFLVLMSDGRPAVALEVGEYGELSDVAEHLPDNEVGDQCKSLVLRQAMEGLLATQQSGITHDDVKRQNYYLTETGVKLADYGEAREGDKFSRPRDEAKNATYVDPVVSQAILDVNTALKRIQNEYDGYLKRLDKLSDEGREASEYYIRQKNDKRADARANAPITSGFKSDIWSFGLMAFYMYEKRDPFSWKESPSEVNNQQEQYMGLKTDRARHDFLFPDGSQTPEKMKQFILSCMDPDPANRPSASAVLESGIFDTEMDEATLQEQIINFMSTPKGKQSGASLQTADPGLAQAV